MPEWLLVVLLVLAGVAAFVLLLSLVFSVVYMPNILHVRGDGRTGRVRSDENPCHQEPQDGAEPEVAEDGDGDGRGYQEQDGGIDERFRVHGESLA